MSAAGRGGGAPEPVRVVQLQRRSFPGHYSMERVFAQVRARLPADVHAELRVTRHYNRGLLPRLRTVLEAPRLAGPVTHVTGDINYAVLLLRRDRTMLTVHDTEFLLRAGAAKRLLYTWFWLALPARRVALLTVPSEATRRDLGRHVGRRAGEIVVVPNPVDEAFQPLPMPRNDPPRVLLVGTRPNKNLPRAVAALAEVDCRIVVLGLLSADQRALLAGCGRPVDARGAVDDAALRAAYAECDLLLFPSTAEGFGIPVLEAQATGRPVVTSDREPMRSVAGGAACLVDPADVGSIRAGVTRVLSEPGYRSELIRRGLDNVQRYRVAEVAEAYAGLYRRLARPTPRGRRRSGPPPAP